MKPAPLSHRFTGSTRVESAEWDPTHQTVTVAFPDGNRWIYRGVPEHIWRDFIDAASPGRFLNGVLTHYSGGPA